MKTALIIATYNWKSALNLCLESVLNQKQMPDEIIIADDGSREDTRELILRFQQLSPVPLIHVWHEDTGFRLAEIRNKAIKQSSCDYIIQIDGDVILHPYFVKDHIQFAQKNSFIKGRRSNISSKKSAEILKNHKAFIRWYHWGVLRKEHGFRSSFLHKMFKSEPKSTADGVMGSNMAFWKKDFMLVNGYNNQLQGWGAEDKELAQRLVNMGLVQRKLKFAAVQYHIYHKESDKSNQSLQLSEVDLAKEHKIIQCQHGIAQV
jgi:glycosyltransferase involved in cell wall biosynthesis